MNDGSLQKIEPIFFFSCTICVYCCFSSSVACIYCMYVSVFVQPLILISIGIFFSSNQFSLTKIIIKHFKFFAYNLLIDILFISFFKFCFNFNRNYVRKITGFFLCLCFFSYFIELSNFFHSWKTVYTHYY